MDRRPGTIDKVYRICKRFGALQYSEIDKCYVQREKVLAFALTVMYRWQGNSLR